MASLALLPLNAANSATSAYGLWLSYVAGKNVRVYEDATKRAARYTNVAVEQLTRTRTTVGAGAVASLYSLLTQLPPLLISQPSGFQIMIHAAFRAGALELARRHIAAFWMDKQKIPGATAYNEGIEHMRQLCVTLRWMIIGAGVEAVLGGIRMVLF